MRYVLLCNDFFEEVRLRLARFTYGNMAEKDRQIPNISGHVVQQRVTIYPF